MKVWLVNTNSSDDNGNPNGFKFMIRHNKVAAFYDKRTKVDKIEKGDLVLLYHNDNRIIAVGFAIDGPNHDFEDLELVEHWVDVNWFWKASFNKKFEPINSIDRNLVGITMVNNTVVNITGQIKLRELLKSIGDRQSF